MSIISVFLMHLHSVYSGVIIFLIIYSVCTDETTPTQAYWWFQMSVVHILSHNVIFWVHFY